MATIAQLDSGIQLATSVLGAEMKQFIKRRQTCQHKKTVKSEWKGHDGKIVVATHCVKCNSFTTEASDESSTDGHDQAHADNVQVHSQH